MRKLAEWIVKYRFVFAIAFAALAIAGIYTSTLVKQNYDMTEYLPSDTDTSRGLAVMNGEFGANNNVLLMLDINEGEVDDMKTRLGAIDGVTLVTVDSYRDGKALYLLTLGGDEYSSEAKATLNAIREFLGSENYALSGGLVSSSGLEHKLKIEIPIIMIVAVVIIFCVLLLTSHSWLEPVVFAIVLLCAVLINMGSNIIFGEISYITFAVSAILQIALAMDYSIILLHGFTARKNKGMSKEEALIDALEYNMRPISSSGLTTIAGLISLLFMTFTIGFDIGIVLAKGILISLLSVFLLMPSLILIFSKALDKTAHKPIPLGGGKIAGFSISGRKVITVIMAAVIVAACILQFGNTYTFTGWDESVGQQAIIDNFGYVNQAVVIIDKERAYDREVQEKFENSLKELKNDDGDPALKSVNAWATLSLDYDMLKGNLNVDMGSIKPVVSELFGGTKVGDIERAFSELDGNIYALKISRRALSLLIKGIDGSMLDSVYETLSQNGEMTVQSALNNFNRLGIMVQAAVPTEIKRAISILKDNKEEVNDALSGLLPPVLESLEQKYGAEQDLFDIEFDFGGLYEQICEAVFGTNKIVVSKLDEMLSAADGKITDIAVTKEMIRLFAHTGMQNEQIDRLLSSISDGGEVALSEFAEYVCEHRNADVITASFDGKAIGVMTLLHLFGDTLSDALGDKLTGLLATLKSNFIGSGHGRIILLMDLPQDGEATFASIEAIKSAATECFGENDLAGSSMTVKDISDAFSSDLLKINLVTIISIFLIIAVLFRSITLPVILVFVIQGAIWITMALYAITGTPIFFMSYIICLCIQMGATIDYGILISSNYRHNRASMEKREAIIEAVRSAMPTIFTSGLILIAAGFIIGFISTVMPIYSIGIMLGIGTIISILLILFLLPAVLYIFDKAIFKTTWDGIKNTEKA